MSSECDLDKSDHEELRASPRHPVHEKARIMALQSGFAVVCSVLDISQGGCKLFAEQPFPARKRIPVEVTFKICGLPLRFGGIIKWTDFEGTMGIEFVDVSPRRKEALALAVEDLKSFKAEKVAQLRRIQ
jgi:PilZ domain